MKYEVRKLTPYRLMSIYAYDALETGHNMCAQIELDVTGIRQRLRAQRRAGRNISFFGYLLSAIAKTIDRNRELNHIRSGKRIYCFDEIDICIPIELELDGVPIPRIYIVRDAAKKTMAEITLEVENAKKHWRESGDVSEEDKKAQRWLELAATLPGWLTTFIIRHLPQNPFKIKKMFGTTYVVSVSGFTDATGFIVPYFEGRYRPLAFAIGSVAKKPGVMNSEIKIREYLSLTISINHDLVDGAPAARFIDQLKQRIEGYGEDCGGAFDV